MKRWEFVSGYVTFSVERPSSNILGHKTGLVTTWVSKGFGVLSCRVKLQKVFFMLYISKIMLFVLMPVPSSPRKFLILNWTGRPLGSFQPHIMYTSLGSRPQWSQSGHPLVRRAYPWKIGFPRPARPRGGVSIHLVGK